VAVTVNYQQIARVANFLKEQEDDGHNSLNFYSFGDYVATDMYPELDHPQAINFFFFVCLHQFGFWFGDANGYLEPLYSTFDGKEVKGSDALWKACMRAMDFDETIFEPERLANIGPKELFYSIFCDDNGPIPFPDLEARFKLTRSYGKSVIDPSGLVRKVNRDKSSLRSFLELSALIPGFDQDELRKKNLLLAMALANRPEQFLKASDPENWMPIIDYHLMRLALRMGLINLNSYFSQEWNKDRSWVKAGEEMQIRSACFEAIKELIRQSGHTMSFVDHKLWSGRKYCPEMKEPDCQNCPFSSVCKKRTELFQPVFRTTAY